jgi:flagellar hook assembly protein FlgD
VQSNAAGNHESDIPTHFALIGNYPNPFNSTTEIRYDVPKTAAVSLVLYNLLGQEVRTLTNRVVPAGHQRIFWDARDNNGLDVGSGIYLLHMNSENVSFTGKVMLVR